ncbi:MAG: glycosyltransferase [Aureispira sp.]|nr:glycosyltransferase [Aureispira sp.]
MFVTLYILISIVLIVSYLGIIKLYITGWQQLPYIELPKHYTPTVSISIIVAARNEAKAIKDCLESLAQQNYPKHLFEILVVDDNSEDITSQIVCSFGKISSNIRLIRLNGFENRQGKKQAIATGIEQSNGNLIVTTDADCIMGSDWLYYIAYMHESEGAKFIAAPVVFHNEYSTFEQFQTLDFMGMMAITGAGIHKQFMHMCNGANLAYTKAVFEEVNGFEGIDHIASGDDMLLMQKVAKKYPNQLRFIKNKAATTYTNPKSTLKGFMQQRIRWASKSSAYTEWQVVAILGLVWIFSVSILLDLILAIWLGWWLVGLAALKLVLKGIADYFLLNMMAHFFGRSALMKAFVPSLFLHWIYIVVIGFLGNVLSSYEWKGRQVK